MTTALLKVWSASAPHSNQKHKRQYCQRGYNTYMGPNQPADQNGQNPAPSEFYQAQHGVVQSEVKIDTITFKADTYAHKLPPYARPKVIGAYFLGVILLWFITRISPLFIIMFSLPAILILFFTLTEEGRQLLRKVFHRTEEDMINKPKN